MRVDASAPGKLVLLGEYAVVFGSPAVVMAVDRRATVHLEPSPDELCSVRAPGFAPEPARFTAGADGEIHWGSDASADRDRFVLVERLLESMARADLVDPASLRPFEAVLDTRAFFEALPHARVKLGVGSSAALTTALASALVRWTGAGELLSPRRGWLANLLTLHREFQGGRGSGIDLAASVIGGVVEYRLDAHGAVGEAVRLDLPEDLHMLFVWTGRSADTGDFLAQLFRELAAEGQAVNRALGRLEELSTSGIDDLRGGRTSSFLAVVDAFCDAMHDLGATVGLPILSPVHERIRDLSRDHGVHYKPSGAGGGDMGIAFASDAEALHVLAPQIAAHGLQTVRLRVDATGLKI